METICEYDSNAVYSRVWSGPPRLPSSKLVWSLSLRRMAHGTFSQSSSSCPPLDHACLSV